MVLITSQHLDAMDKRQHTFSDLRFFLLIIGNSRSGSTALGSVIAQHPNAMIAQESPASSNYWRDIDREQLLEQIRENALANEMAGRPWQGYQYSVPVVREQNRQILVAGDKIWNPATLLLHGDIGLIGRLEQLLGVPILILESLRHPLDCIAAMHKRSSASLEDRVRWYFMHLEATAAIRSRMTSDNYRCVYHEHLIESPDIELTRLFRFLNLPDTPEPIQKAKDILFKTPERKRGAVEWPASVLRDVEDRMSRLDSMYPYLN